MLRLCLFVTLAAMALLQGICQPKAVQIFTAKDGITMTKRPSYLTIDKSGLLWFGTDNGLLSFDGFNFKTYAIPNSDPGKLPYSVVAYNYQDKLGTYWCVLYKNGLYNYNPVTQKFTPFAVPPAIAGKLRLDSVDTRFPFEDSKGNLWIQICGYGLLRINEKTKATRGYSIKDLMEVNYYISGSWMNSFYEQPDGTLYIGTNDGIVEMNPETGVYKIYKEGNSNPMPDCRCILTSLKKGNTPNEILCGSWGNGIKIFNTMSKTFTTHPLQKDGLPCASNVLIDVFRLTDTTFFVVKRDEWEKTGFCIYNITTGLYTPIKGVEPKFTWREYNTIVHDGDFLWVPNLSQLYRFYIPALRNYQTLSQATIPAEQKRILQPIVSTIWVNGLEQTNTSKPLLLKADENTFRIQYGCIGATLQDSVQFACKMDGIDNNWNLDYQPSLQYSGLPAGNYTFHIKVHKAPFNFAQQELTIVINKEAYWWQTAWFKVLAIAALIMLLYCLYRLRIRQIRRQDQLKNKYEQRLAEMEMKALRAQMNPHFIFNCLNSINRYIVKSDHKTASYYLTKFSKLIRLILDNSANDIISLQKETDTLDLYIQMEAMRFHNSFNYSIEMDASIDPERVHIPSMLVQPYIENAIWHGLLHKTDGNAFLKIRFINNDGNAMRILVEDNGIGRQKASELKSRDTVKTKSYGMQISSDRITLINHLYKVQASIAVTDLYNEKDVACGTRVIIDLPMMNS